MFEIRSDENFDTRTMRGVSMKRILLTVLICALVRPALAQQPPHDEFLLAATAQNLRKLAKLIPVPAPMPS